MGVYTEVAVLSLCELASIHRILSARLIQEALCQSYVERAIALLRSQNEMVANHPNSHIYSQLLSMVDFDGYYLENKPCLVCNDPEVPYSVSGIDCLHSCIDYIPVATSKEPCHTPFLQVMKLYSMKSEVRYSPNMILFKLVGSFTVSQVSGIAN